MKLRFLSTTASIQRWICLLMLLSFLSLATVNCEAADEGTTTEEVEGSLPAEIKPTQYLIIPRVGNYRRGTFHQDPIEAQLAQADWKPPKKGDKVVSAVGVETQWRDAGPQTVGRIYAGGYAATSFESADARTMAMESSGCAAVWLNGQWYVGNPYGLKNRSSIVPIKQGTNHLVVHLANPQARPRFSKPEADLLIQSTLLPDAVVEINEEGTKTIMLGPGSVQISNATDQSMKDLLLVVDVAGFDSVKTRVNNLPGRFTLNAPFKLPSGKLLSSEENDNLPLKIQLLKPVDNKQSDEEESDSPEEILASYETTLNLVSPNEVRTETFLSMVDKSVQKYAYLPPKDLEKLESPPALAVVLHNAGEDCFDLLKKSKPLDGIAQIAPFGRGLHGFDWEDWSADDVQEAMADALTKVSFDSERVAIIGQGMGGHGALWLGCTKPNRFAAVSVCDGWLNLLLPNDDLPQDIMLKNLTGMVNRRANASNLFELTQNLQENSVRLYQSEKQKGTARTEMLELRSILGSFHPDFAYRETEIRLVDQIKEAIEAATINANRRKNQNPNKITFISPGIETLASLGWATIESPIEFGKAMQLQLTRDDQSGVIEGTTKNIRRITLSLKGMERKRRVQIKLDQRASVPIVWPSRSSEITIERNEEGSWGTPRPPEIPLLRNLDKSAIRPSGLKPVFQNNPVLVYGTQGNEEENRWSKAKAIYDAEMFAYRGSGHLEVIPDREFKNDEYRNRNVICYGNFKTNRAARSVFRITQINVAKDQIRVGERPERGDDLSILMVGPRVGSKSATTALIGGTGIVGMRNTTRLRYFWSGVHYPDLLIFGPQAISPPKGTTSVEDVRAVGYRSLYWEVKKGEIVWRDLAL